MQDIAQPLPARRSRRSRLSWRPARTTVAAGLLAAVAIAWAAVPMSGAGRDSTQVLIIASCCAVLAVAHLAVRPAEATARLAYVPLAARLWWRLTAATRAIPWAEGAVVAVLVLEALHRSRPWHTAVLGAALLGYLFATHLAETGAPPRSLRPQLPLIAAGLGLLALAVGAAALPVGGGAATSWLRVLAAAAAVIVGVLIVPV